MRHLTFYNSKKAKCFWKSENIIIVKYIKGNFLAKIIMLFLRLKLAAGLHIIEQLNALGIRDVGIMQIACGGGYIVRLRRRSERRRLPYTTQDEE